MTDKLSPTVLLPCPFCGNAPERISYMTVGCRGIVDGKDTHNSFYMTPEAWNTRTSPAPTGGVVTDLAEAIKRAWNSHETLPHIEFDPGEAESLARAVLAMQRRA